MIGEEEMQFSKMQYTRTTFAKLCTEFDSLQDKISAATSQGEALSLFWQYEKICAGLATARTLAEIRNTIDTTDAFYEA